jgi:hypothetical protein
VFIQETKNNKHTFLTSMNTKKFYLVEDVGTPIELGKYSDMRHQQAVFLKAFHFFLLFLPKKKIYLRREKEEKNVYSSSFTLISFLLFSRL